jgi:transcriptional activator SPT7
MFNHTAPFPSFRASPYAPAHANGLSKRKASNMTEDGPLGPGPPLTRLDTSDAATEEDPRVITFRNAYHNAELALNAVLRGDVVPFGDVASNSDDRMVDDEAPIQTAPPVAKKPARAIDEDDYDDYDDDEDEKPLAQSPVLQKTTNATATTSIASPASAAASIIKPALLKQGSQVSDSVKAPDDARKKLQQDQQAAEEAARARFHNMFYTLEYDRAAMMEQQRIDELDRQVEAEMSADQRNGTSSVTVNGGTQGTLSSANLGASSLMLKHLLARIDSKRHMVKAQDWQLRKLISEVRKNRSKWASEDKIGQEELYEAAEKVLSDLKAMTEHSGPFLNRVNKREAPDYYNIIKHPMDIGTMMKKLKGLQYKSKKEFVDDLNLIWSNCLTYNTDPNHPLRKKALHLQKHSEQMLFLIPDIVVRDRAEVEAEERRLQNLDAELDGLEDSDDGSSIHAKAF